MKKAFDSLHHECIIECFNHLNIGPELVQWIKLFYNDIRTMIINNGHLSEPFKVERGVKQGCPLSFLLFIICIEILSNHIQQNENMKGINLMTPTLKQTLYVDDATYYIDGSETLLSELIFSIEEFGKNFRIKV